MRAFRRQRGVTMASLLVSMMISVIGIIAILSLYKNLVQQTVVSSRRTAQDGQITAGLLTAQIELQGAGFGIATASGAAKTNTDFILLTDAYIDGNITLHGTALSISSTAASGNALVWGDNPSYSAYQCNALIVTGGGLVWLRATSGCTQATQWSSATWSRTADLVMAGALNQPNSTFTASRAGCAPYGKGLPLPAIVLTIQARGVVSGLSNGAAMCLPNFLT